MAQWKGTNDANGQVTWGYALVDAGSGSTAQAANNAALFQNTTPNAFKVDMVTGQFGVSPAEKANTTGEGARPAHAGWNFRRAGTGPLLTITPATGGTGYSNTDVIKVSGGQVNATGTPTTNSTGGIVSVAVTLKGEGFANTSSLSFAVANSSGGATAGANATFTGTLGGRAGRVHYETLVAMGTLPNNASNDTYLPQ